VPIPRRPFGFETPTQVLEGTGGSRCEPKYSHNSHLKGSLNFATVRCKGSTLMNPHAGIEIRRLSCSGFLLRCSDNNG
jgi:hypothetical protein